MTPEPNDPNLFDEPMDTRLLQLERELFSLSPAAPPRGLVSRLDDHLSQPTVIERRVVAQVIPFRWSRIVVPAAAAVVVVSALSRMEGPRVMGASQLTAQPGARQINPTVMAAPASLQRTSSGYLLKEEPVLVHPLQGEWLQHQYWIQPSGPAANHYPPAGMLRASDSVPLNFH